MRNRTLPILLCVVTMTYLFAYLYGVDKTYLSDESTHAWIISKFYHGEYVLLDHLTMLPGYHALCALFEKFIAFKDSLATQRLFSVITGIICTIVFYFIHKNIHKEKTFLKTLQFSYLPLIFPFFFLVYTDIPSLLTILIALLFFIKKRYWTMGFALLISLLIRQNNIIWVGFFVCLLLFDNYQGIIPTLKKAVSWVFLKKNLITIFVILSFIAFVIINKGVAIGDKDQHPSFSLKPQNLYFFLFLILFLNLPIFISEAKNIYYKLKKILVKPRNIVITIVGISAFYFFYNQTFEITHTYNHMPTYYWFLRNIFLDYVVNNAWAKIAFFILMLYSILTLIFIEFRSHKEKILYLIFSTLSLIPFWLIEVRYSIVAAVLFMLFAKPKKDNIEVTQLYYNAILSFALFYTIIETIYFP